MQTQYVAAIQSAGTGATSAHVQLAARAKLLGKWWQLPASPIRIQYVGVTQWVDTGATLARAKRTPAPALTVLGQLEQHVTLTVANGAHLVMLAITHMPMARSRYRVWRTPVAARTGRRQRAWHVH